MSSLADSNEESGPKISSSSEELKKVHFSFLFFYFLTQYNFCSLTDSLKKKKRFLVSVYCVGFQQNQSLQIWKSTSWLVVSDHQLNVIERQTHSSKMANFIALSEGIFCELTSLPYVTSFLNDSNDDDDSMGLQI